MIQKGLGHGSSELFTVRVLILTRAHLQQKQVEENEEFCLHFRYLGTKAEMVQILVLLSRSCLIRFSNASEGKFDDYFYEDSYTKKTSILRGLLGQNISR